MALNLILDPVDGATRNALMRCTLDGSCARMTEIVPMPNCDTAMAARYVIVRP